MDIISMSFGYEAEVEVIEKAFKKADDNNVLLIVAANTALAQRWPGTRDNVMSVSAADGHGSPYSGNPPPRRDAYNLATLGVMVPVWSVPDEYGNSRKIHRTGTSYAAPIAAAIAASVLELIRHTEDGHMNHVPEEWRERLQAASRPMGMRKVFMRMAVKRGGYDFVLPARLLNTGFESPVSVLNRLLETL